MASAEKLVIVESPTKAKTIRKYLGKGYRVEASMGHVQDLPASADEVPKSIKGKPWARLGVNVEENYAPVYVIPREKKKVVAELRKALKDADELYLATDEDREGESIGWHLVQVLDPKVPVRRMVFHEITEDAIHAAINSPRELDTALVQAQETRRVLDRLVGYTVSPLLWKKVAPRLSAGRVQSVAVRLLVIRERERMAFVSGTYWDLKAKFERTGVEFDGQLISVNGKRLATGKDFDENTGKIPPEKDVLLLEEGPAMALVEGLKGRDFVAHSVETRQSTRSPYPPFTTSTLQQESNRKLGLSANRTMRIAQRLYEQGYITYMRTDSTHLAKEAVVGVRGMIEERYGKEYLSEGVREFTTKSKGAQEAHEAIRPAGVKMPTVDELGLTGEQAKMYELIWKRTVATQMAEAQLAFTTAKFIAEAPDGTKAEFRSSGREVVFPGFFRAYVEGSDDPSEALDDRNQPLPAIAEGDTADCKDLEGLSHETKPPARYTEASLVKGLEAAGIGRPSTYASIIGTIQRRGYVMNKNKQLIPTFTAMAVTQLLEKALSGVVDLEFTAGMEERLDEIAEGKSALEYLDKFYKEEILKGVEDGITLDAAATCAIHSKALDPHEIRVGRYGAFLEYAKNDEGKGLTVSLPAEMAPGDVTKDYLDHLVAVAKRGRTPIGKDPEGEDIYVLSGPYGPYVQRSKPEDPKERPKRVSVPKTMDPLHVQLDTAVALLGLPRTLGEHPETAKKVRAGIGRYGPYVTHNQIYASLKADDDVLTVELERALELLADKKVRRRRSDPIKELGNHPEDQQPVRIMEGPYGAYIKYKSHNVSIPDGFGIDDVNLEVALPWIEEKIERKGLRDARAEAKKERDAEKAAEKAAKKKAKKKKAKKKATKKKATKKAASKKKTTKKAASKKKTTKKKTASKKKATKKASKKTSKKKASAKSNGASPDAPEASAKGTGDSPSA